MTEECQPVRKPMILREIAPLRTTTAAWRAGGEEIALVPTMGALHEGHLALVAQAAKWAPRVVVSIFVNPAQFAPHEDFDRYPRTEEADVARLAGTGASLVWAPTATEMYPAGFATRIAPGGAAEGLESDFRPHFFGGVTTVVAKLFNQVRPDYAVFGEKDYQQLCVVRQLVRDLDMAFGAAPLQIVGLPTIREGDGLALSSRNRYLTPAERAIAPAMHRAMQEAASAIRAGAEPSAAVTKATDMIHSAGFAKIDYVAVRDAATLSATLAPGRPLRLLAAAWLGQTRLIDNIAV
jgi:pantoate--beta-alanine ligase